MHEPDRTLSECPTLQVMASYLDGRMNDADLAAMERHLADCPACRAAIHEFRAMQVEGDPTMVFVPPHVLVAAQGLVQNEASRSHRSSFVFIRRAAAMAASIALGVGGYQVGTNLSPTDTSTSTDETDDVYFGLLDATASDQTASDWLTLELPEASS